MSPSIVSASNLHSLVQAASLYQPPNQYPSRSGSSILLSLRYEPSATVETTSSSPLLSLSVRVAGSAHCAVSVSSAVSTFPLAPKSLSCQISPLESFQPRKSLPSIVGSAGFATLIMERSASASLVAVSCVSPEASKLVRLSSFSPSFTETAPASWCWLGIYPSAPLRSKRTVYISRMGILNEFAYCVRLSSPSPVQLEPLASFNCA